MQDPTSPPDMIGQSPAFLDALAHTSATALLERPVLIAGERGTGKELLAGRLHFLSSRWEGPFIKVNCAALAEELLESELFGHEAGAFTGASKRHRGRFERAQGGTLFLDEIASASLRIQEKLLRVIEYGEYERLGGETTRHADVRVVAAANIDLRALVATGRFRADLLDRLAFEVITAPPMRARLEDIPILAAHFAGRFANELTAMGIEASFDGFTPGAMARLKAYDWPGNVRELKNAAERSLYRWTAAQMQGPVDEIALDPFASEFASPALAHFSDPQTGGHFEGNPPGPAPTGAPPHDMSGDIMTREGFSLRNHLNAMEHRLTRNALDANGWNQKRTATFLHLTYDQIRGLIRKHGLKE